MRVIYGLFLILLLQSICISPVQANDDAKESVVKIYTVFNRYNYHEPWQMMGQSTFQGSGSIIEGKKILTNAPVVSDQTFIQVRRGGKAKKYTAEVEAIAHESDLAILRVKDDSFFSGVKPLKIGELPQVRDKVAVFGFPEGGDRLSITEGVVSRIEHTNYAHSGAYLLSCQIDASINSGSSGGPVIKDNQIVGVAFQGLVGGLSSIGYMVPAPVIKHFLDDIKDGRHDGTPDLGISMQKMENPDLRSNFLMTEEQTGILVNKVYPDSPAKDILKSEDVILSIDSEGIENDGTVEFRKGERTFFAYLLQQKQVNDTVQLKILRNGGQKVVDIKLTKAMDFERLVPQRQYDIAPTYYVTGGLIFEPLTLNYLMEFGAGNSWYYNAPTELLNYYVNGEPSDKQRDIVILVKVLADEINVGFHDSGNVVVAYVNGKKISTMKDLLSAFEEHKGEYYVVEDIRGYKIALKKENVKASHQRILDKYKIKSDISKDLEQWQKAER